MQVRVEPVMSTSPGREHRADSVILVLQAENSEDYQTISSAFLVDDRPGLFAGVTVEKHLDEGMLRLTFHQPIDAYR